MKKIVIPGIVAAIVSLAASMVVGYLFQIIMPSLKLDYENPNMFRPWSDPIMNIFWIHPFLLVLPMAWIWDKTKHLFTGSYFNNVLTFTVISWFVSNLPGMILSYSSFKISLFMTVTWSITGLVQVFVAMLIVAKMNKK